MAILSLYIIRLVDWQIINGQKYLEVANKSNIFVTRTDALRGEILDTNGTAFAETETGYRIVFDRFALDKENEVIVNLINLMKLKKEPWIDELPISVNKNGTFDFIEGKDKEISDLKSKNRLNLNSYATANDCMDKLAQKFNCSQYEPNLRRDLTSVKYNMLANGYYQAINTSYVFAEGISQELVSIICEKYQDTPGVRINLSSKRKISNPDLAPHLIGVTGQMSSEQFDEFKEKGYSIEDIVGKSGIELAMEDYLRGEAGEKKIEISREGNVLNVLQSKNAQPGKTIFLTINSKIQKAANESLGKYIKSIKSSAGSSGKGYDCKAGAAVLLNIKDFSVLAAATYPGYDLTRYVNDKSYYNEVTKDSCVPLFNRALNGSFAPGSVFKPLVACGAFEENVATPKDRVTCHGIYHYPGSDFTTKCLGIHGAADFKYALAKSCNVYFSEMGRRLGINNMNIYCKRFGLGVKTGIEVPETSGVIAGPEHSRSLGMAWSDKVTIKAAIGQSDNLFSPVQLATYVATIANGGNRYKTHFVRKITDYRRENTIMENDPEKPELLETSGISTQNLNIVKEGMRQVVLDGTASVFNSYGINIAAKTGTAQNSGSDHTLFIFFAPYENPEIAGAVILEHGAIGLASKGVAKDILDAYFY
ncbi:MAG: Peptidoglycan D,D-transpeptidase MrdA [Eubacteriales bacterium SKADARSKE-1]|nr:Peptidoglycan D,D-transpeptidase MrdA [Eubacteriales bacterium SKADARSKE-1]